MVVTPPTPSVIFDHPKESSEVSILSEKPTVALTEVKQESDSPRSNRVKETNTRPSKRQQNLYSQEGQ